MEYTVSGKTYDLLLQDGHIILQSLNEDLIYEYGFEACKQLARSYCQANAKDEYGRFVGYSESQVEDIAMDYIADYIKTESYTTLTHDLN